MKIYVYKNGLCDPERKFGVIKQFSNSEDVDGFIKTLCVSIKPLAHRRLRVFITNDEVEQHEVDHYVLMGDSYGLDFRTSSIKEVDTLAIAAECNERMASVMSAEDKRVQLLRSTI